jgi:E2F/DP family winged-helix DNA-binding domain
MNEYVATPNQVMSSSSSSSMMSKHVFCPPRPPLIQNKKPYPTTAVTTTPTSDMLYTSMMINSSSTQHCPSSTVSVKNNNNTYPNRNVSNITQNDNDHQHQKYNRKNKSLGVLAESFLKHFTTMSRNQTSSVSSSNMNDTTANHIVAQEEDDICQEIMIDKLSVELAVERRRIYDVVNILEALQVIVKMGKNTYHWMGREHLTRQFALLQNEAIESWPEYAAKAGFVPSSSTDTMSMSTTMSSMSHADDPSNDQDPITKKHKKAVALIDHIEGPNKSLTRLSQLFLQVFLIGAEPLSLPQASDLIHGGRSTHDELVALGMKPGDVYPTNEKHLQQVAARGLKTKIRRLYDIANVFLSVGLLRKSENRAAPTTDGKRPFYCLNYHLTIHEIRSVYQSLPAHMLKSKSPFSDEQWSKFNRIAPFRVNIKYFGLSEPTSNVVNNNNRHQQHQDQQAAELMKYPTSTGNEVCCMESSNINNNIVDSSCQVNVATTTPVLPQNHDQSTDVKDDNVESPMATTNSVTTPTTTPSSSTTSTSMMKLQGDEKVPTTLSPPDSSMADSVDSKNSKMIDRCSLLNNIHIVGGAGTTTDDDHYHQHHHHHDGRNMNHSNHHQPNQIVLVAQEAPTTSPLSSSASPTMTKSTSDTPSRIVSTTSPSTTTTSSSFVVAQLSPRRVSMEK